MTCDVKMKRNSYALTPKDNVQIVCIIQVHNIVVEYVHTRQHTHNIIHTNIHMHPHCACRPRSAHNGKHDVVIVLVVFIIITMFKNRINKINSYVQASTLGVRAGTT